MAPRVPFFRRARGTFSREDFDDSAIWHRLPRVEQDIMEDLAHLAGIDIGGPEILSDPDTDAGRCPARARSNRVLEYFGHGSHMADRSASLGERQ